MCDGHVLVPSVHWVMKGFTGVQEAFKILIRVSWSPPRCVYQARGHNTASGISLASFSNFEGLRAQRITSGTLAECPSRRARAQQQAGARSPDAGLSRKCLEVVTVSTRLTTPMPENPPSVLPNNSRPGESREERRRRSSESKSLQVR